MIVNIARGVYCLRRFITVLAREEVERFFYILLQQQAYSGLDILKMAEGRALSVLLNNAVEMIYFSAHGPSNDASDTENWNIHIKA